MARPPRTKQRAVTQNRVIAPAELAAKRRRASVLVAAGLAAITLAVYAQVVGHEFISLDDDLYIKNNEMVNRGLSLQGLAWAFTTFRAANWHPLTWISHMIDSQIFGMNAGGHLFVNTLFHIANTLLVFWLLRRATSTLWPSAIVAALFALHPLHVESVAWAAERKDVLATLFGLLSLIFYCRYAEARSVSRYLLTAATLALGLMAKPTLVTWPFVMLLLDYWPLRRFPNPETARPDRFRALMTLVREKVPFFYLVIASAVITVIAQTHGGAVRTLEDAPVWLRLANAVVSYAKYLLLTFWPNNLAIYYPFDYSGIPAWQIIGSVLLLLGVTAFCLFQAKARPCLLVGWLWFAGTLVPVIGIVQVGGQTMADRYHYVPSIGLFIAIVFGLADIVQTRRVPAAVNALLAGAVVAALTIFTFNQIGFWRDSITLFERTLAVTPPNLIIENNLALVLGKKGRYDEAATHLERALDIKPDAFDALYNMGVTRAQQGRLAEAVDFFQRTLQVDPESAKTHTELGLALAKQHQLNPAREHLQQAAHLDPENADILTNLGLVLLRLRQIPEAFEHLQEAVRLNPNSAEAHNNLGLALLGSGKPRESIAEFETALRLNPNLKVAHDNIRRAQAQLESRR